MGRLLKFFRLSPSERGLLMEAVFLLFWVQARLLVSASSYVKERLKVPSKELIPKQTAAARISVRHIIWAVTVVGRYLHGKGGCLPQALAAQILLRKHGFPSAFKIGVARNGEASLQAHAWLENEGEVLIGKLQTENYQALSP